jgi:di/tricarboxylate transporter
MISSGILIVLGILIAAIVLFVADRYSPDIVALLVVLALILTRSLSITDALGGFANPAVITIAAIFLITAGLTNTGVAARIGAYLFGVAGKNEARLVAVTMGASAMLSLFMNNIAAGETLAFPGKKLCGIRRLARTRIGGPKNSHYLRIECDNRRL